MSGVSSSTFHCSLLQSNNKIQISSRYRSGSSRHALHSGVRLCLRDGNLKRQAARLRFVRESPRRPGFRCNSTTGPGSGDNESKSVLDAFFLGKALAEALNERIESAVGEFLSTVGRLQAEQQKQLQEFQDDVLERAKTAKEQAAREAMEVQRITPNLGAQYISAASGVTSAPPRSTANDVSRTNSPPSPNPATTPPAKSGPDPLAEDPVLGVPDDD